MAYVIKRYSNRKLYDTQESRYVTLEEIEEMIRAGKEMAVVDAASGEDLTSVTLAQIILENERNHRATLPTAFLHQLIKHGVAWQDFVQRSMKSSLEGIVSSQREMERIFQDWASRAGWGMSGPRADRAATAPSPTPSSSARKCRPCESVYAPSRSGSKSARTRSSRLALVDALHLLDDCRVRVLDALARLLRRRLEPLGRARDRLSLSLQQLDGLLDAVHPAEERLLVELRRILHAVRPGALPARGRRLGALQCLDRALLQLAAEPHALLRGCRRELHELTQHALLRVGPHRHRFDHLASELTKRLFHHFLLHVLFASLLHHFEHGPIRSRV